MKRLAIVILLSSGLVMGVNLPVRADGTSTPVIPASGNGNPTPVNGGELTFDGVLGTIDNSLDTVDDFLNSGGQLLDGLIGEAGDILGGLLGDTGGQISGLFRDVARVVNLIDRVANTFGKIGGFWQDFYRSALGVVGEGKECLTSPVIVNASPSSPLGFSGIDYDPTTWCFGVLANRGGGNQGSGDGSGKTEGDVIPILDNDGNVTVVPAPVSPSEIFVGEPNVDVTGGATRPKSIPEIMALGARGTAAGIPDPIELRRVANEVELQNSDNFETIEPVRTYHALDSVENGVIRMVGVQPLSKDGQKQIADTVGGSQQMIVRSAQLAASAGGKKITQDVLKDMASIGTAQSTLLGSIASDTATNRLQTGATNIALSTISRQLAEQQKYERARLGVLAGQLLLDGFSSDLR